MKKMEILKENALEIVCSDPFSYNINDVRRSAVHVRTQLFQLPDIELYKASG